MRRLLGVPALENAAKLLQPREEMDYINRVKSYQNSSRSWEDKAKGANCGARIHLVVSAIVFCVFFTASTAASPVETDTISKHMPIR